MADTTQEQPVDAPVAAATVEGPPPAKRKLYDSMVKDKLYTKSFDAFNTQFSTPDKVNNLHSFLTQKGKYDKDANTFGSQFFSDVVKKKGLSEPGSNSGSSTSAAPSSTSQPTDNTPPPAPMVMPPNAIAPENVLSSVGDGTYAPAPYTPQTQAVIKQLENEQIAQEQKQKDLQASNVMQMLDDFKKNIPKAPDARQNDPTAYLDYLAKKPKSPKEEEFKGTTGDRIALGALTAQNNLYKGLGTAVTGLITAANFAAKTIIPANEVIEPAEWDKARDNLNAYVDKFTKGLQWEIEPKTQEQINGNPLQNAINQIANFVPAAIASESTAGQSFYYQGVGDANNQLKEMKAKGMKIDPGVADLYTQLMGVGNYYLMNKLNAHSLLSTFPAKLRNSAIGRASAETIKTLADKGADATGQDIVNVFKNPIMGFGDRVAQLGIDAVKSYGHTAVDLAGLATYGHVINAGANSANQAKGGDEIFHQNPSDLIAQYRDILTSSAPAFTLFGAARTVVDNPGLLFHDSPYQNIVIDRLQKDSSPENIQKIKDDLATIGAQKQWSQDDIVNSQNTVDMVADVASKLPRELRPDKFRDGVDLITHRRALETVLKETQAQKTNLDPAVQSRVSPFEDLLNAKIDQANDKLSTLVTDKGFTYYESNGQYFKKQTDGEPVEITKARYDLEDLENEYKPKATQSIVMPVGSTDKAGNPVPPKVDKDGPLPDNTDISDEDYNKFVDQDKVSPENIDKIAVKVRDKQPLSEREKAIFASRTEDINKSIKDSLQPEVAPKPKADGQTSKAAPAKAENTEKPTSVEQPKPATTVAKVDEVVSDKNGASATTSKEELNTIGQAFQKRFGTKFKVISPEEADNILSTNHSKNLFYQVLDDVDIFNSKNPEESKNFINKVFQTVENAAEAKSAYRKLAVKFHPDKGGHVEVMKYLNEVKEKYDAGKITPLSSGSDSNNARYDAFSKATEDFMKSQGAKNAQEFSEFQAKNKEKQQKKQDIINKRDESIRKFTQEISDYQKQLKINRDAALSKIEKGNGFFSIKLSDQEKATQRREVLKKYADSHNESVDHYKKGLDRIHQLAFEAIQRVDKQYTHDFRFQKNGNQNTGGFYDKDTNTAYLIHGASNDTTAIHEMFSHPFIATVEREHPELFANLLKEAKSDPQVLQHVDKNYTNVDESTKEHEYIAAAIDLEAKGQLKNKRLIDYIKEFWNIIKEKVTKLFGSKVTGFDKDTSIADIVKFVLESNEKLDLSKNKAGDSSPALSNEQEADRHWLENETNPEAIASRYHQENFSTENSADYKEHKIAEAFGTKSKINARDFSRFGDDNILAGDAAFKRRWIDTDNKSQDIDQVAQELTHNTDVEFTPQDIVDFITKYRGKGDFEAKATSGFQTDLEQKYHQLTGKNLSKKAAEEAYNKSKAELSNARLNEDAVEIIDKEGINYGNVDKLRDMFKGFPYSEGDFNNVKRYLENERKQGKSEGEPGKNETPSPGAKSESSSQLGKETGTEGSTPAPGKTDTAKGSGASSEGKEIVKIDRPSTIFDTTVTDGQTHEVNKSIEDANKLKNLKNVNPDGGTSPKRVKDALGDVDKLRFEELRKKLKQNIRSEKNDIDNSGDMSTGYNAELYSTGIELTSLYFKAGVHGFADYAREMISDMGEDVIPYLGSFYEGAKRLPGIKGVFDSTDTVDYHIAKLSETGDPVRVFVDRVKSEIAEGNKLNILRLEGIAAEAGLSTDTRSKLQDHVELALMEVARDITDNPMLDDQEKFNDLIKLYESQPSLLQRSSTSVALQQYSTPLPYSFAAGTYVNDITPGSIYDPTAGTGNLTIAFNPAIASVNEIDPGRLEILRQLGFAPTGENAVTFNPGRSFAGIMANPPFGPSASSVKFHDYVFGKLDYIIPLRALESMKDDGRAAIIIGGHNQYDKKVLLGTDFKFLNYLYHYYNVSDVINVDGGLYAKQGTTFPTRLILVNGRKEVPAGYAPVEDEEANKPVKTYEQLYNRVQERIKNDEKPTVLQSKLDVQPQISLFDDGTGASGVQTSRTSRSRAVSNTSDNEVDRGRDEKPGAGDTTIGRQAGLERDVNRPDGDSEGDNEKQQLADVPESIAKFAPAAQSGSVGPETAGEFVPNDRLLQPARPSASEVVGQDKITYSPASRASQAGSVIPANMAYETEQNLKELEDLYGPIDAFVANELDYHDLTDLNNAFFAEQIDALGLAIHQLKNGQGMIVGDMTGIGKGRVAAGLLRWAVNQGNTPTFFTENADLFSDIYRDLHGIGSGHLIPFIVNDPSGDRDANIKRDGKVIYKANKIEDKRRFFETGKLPAGTNIVLSTYSQLNSEKQFLKRGFITKMTKGSFMFLDESHNVSGDSNSGKFFQDLLGEAKGATFFSATYAKRPDNMPVYALKTAMQDANMTTGALVEAIQTGGNALQEVVSSQLVKAGQMIRRERDFTDVVNQFDTIGTDKDGTVNEQGQKHRELADQVIEVCNSIITFEKDFVEKALGEIQAQLAKEGKRTKDTKSKQLSISNTPFASKMFNIVNQMLFSIKAPDIARIAIEELKAGNKPVIAFNSTMESFIKNNGYKPGDEIDDVSFSASLLNGLKNTLKYRVDFPNGDTEVRYLSLDDLDDEGRASWNSVVDMIKAASAEMSISPIDTIHEIIEDAGYKAGEITGRASKLKFSEDGKSAMVESIGKKDTTGMITDFNGGGATQAILLNAAGATGFSMHADKSFRDQRERVMITGQLELDINKEIQKRGRIDRTNQVRRGRFRYVVSSIPAETRLLMMFRAKLKSLQANTTSSQKSKANDVDVVDFLNEYGDQVITDYLQQNPDTYQKLYQGADPAGLRDIAPGKTARPVEGIARKSTGRAALLTVDEQERFYNEVSQAYNDYIDYLNSIDQNTLEIKSLNLEAETLSKGVYIEGKHTNSPFGQDSMIEKVEANVLRKPLSKVELEEQIDKALDGKTPTEASGDLMRQVTDNYKTIVKRRLDNARELLDKRVKKDAEKYASNKALMHAAQKVHFDEFDKAEEEITNDADQARDKMVAMFRDYKVGTEHMVPTSIYGTEVKYTKGIFLGFSVKDENVYNKFTPSNILMKFAVLDGKRIISATVSRTDFVNALYAAKAQMSINELREMGNLRNHWDEEASKTKDKEIRHIITGNILQAFKPNMGQLASYTTSDGKIHKGIIMPKSFSPEKEGQLVSAVNMHDKIMALANEESVVSSDGTFEIEKFSSTHFGLNVPKATSKGGRYFKNQALLDLVNYSEFNTRGGKMVAGLTGYKMMDLLKVLEKEFNMKFKSGVEMHDVNPDPGDKPTGGGGSSSSKSNSLITPDSGELEYHEQGQDFIHSKSTERIQAENHFPAGRPIKKLPEIISDLAKGLNVKIFHARSARKGAAGSYNPTSAGIKLKAINNLDVAVHEVGHALDDAFDLFNNIPAAVRSQVMDELQWFADRGGSNPPASMSAQSRMEYLKREGIAEFVRAYTINPTQAFRRAPEFFAHFEATLPYDVKEVLREFGNDYLHYNNGTNLDRIMANIEEVPKEQQAGFRKFLESFKSPVDGSFNLTFWDNVKTKFTNSMRPFEKGFNYLTMTAGHSVDNVLPEENASMLAQVFAGVDSKIGAVFADGLVTGKNEPIIDARTGRRMNMEWLYDAFDSTSPETLAQDQALTIGYLFAMRTVEKSMQFDRPEQISGISATGNDTDIDVAVNFLTKEFGTAIPREQRVRILEGARRYQLWSDKMLKYMVDKGRLSQANYRDIKSKNLEYVAFLPVQENEPGVETYFDSVSSLNRRANMGSVKTVIREMQGSTMFKRHPYVSLLQNTAAMIEEADRNEILQSFIEPMLTTMRNMGQGSINPFANVMIEVTQADKLPGKPVMSVYVNGNARYFMFSNDAKDIYDVVNGLSKLPQLPGIVTAIPRAIRFGVTRFPVFAVRNVIRDTFSRLIISRANSGFGSFLKDRDNDKELFQMFGGDQAGYYMGNKLDYYKLQSQIIKDLTHSGKATLANPVELTKKGWNWYEKLLQKGELTNRMAEFRASYTKAVTPKAEGGLGLDEYNANLWAAYQARDLMDFAVAGTWMRYINLMVPFANAQVQGLKREFKAATENGWKGAGLFAMKLALFTILPQLLMRMFSKVGDYEEEYDNLPSYQRDIFWNFKLPNGSWFIIPKPFSLGLPAAGIDRAIGGMEKHENAWAGFPTSLYQNLSILRPEMMAGPMSAAIEPMANYSFFKQGPIVPRFEENKLLELRKKFNTASRLSKGMSLMLSPAFKDGDSVDPRYIDNLFTSMFSYYGETAMNLSDIGSKESRQKFGLKTTGFIRDQQIYGDVRVSKLYDVAEDLGMTGSSQIKRLTGYITDYYNSVTPAERKEAFKQVMEYAKDVYHEWMENDIYKEKVETKGHKINFN